MLLTIVALTLAALYLNRRAAAREVLTGWLDRRGIDAEVEVEQLEIDGFVGRIRIGDPTNPDFSVERVEVDYAVGLPWSAGGLGVTPRRIRLLRPIVRATWTDGALSFGSLDPLVKEFTSRPPRPDSRAPLVIVETGRLQLGTEYGPLQILADARIVNGKLMRLRARMPGASLKSGVVEARGLGGTLDLTTTGDRVALALDFAAERFAAGAVSGEAARLSGTADLPYPDLKSRRGDGRAVLDLTLDARALAAGDSGARDAALKLAFDGSTTGWIEEFRITGETSANVRAASLSGAGASARSTVVALPGARLDLTKTASGLNWKVEGPATLQAASASAGNLSLTGTTIRASRLVAGGRGGAFEAVGPLALSARRLSFGDLSLDGVAGAVDLDLTHSGATLVNATGSMRSAGGAWPLFGPVTADDVPELAGMKRALGAFAIDIPAFRLTTGSPGTALILTAPARLSPANGGVLSLRPAARPVFAAEPGRLGGGALSLVATRGRGLPEAVFDIPDWRLTPGGFEARLDGRSTLDFGIARGLTLTTAGLLATDNGRLTYTASDCVAFAADRLELDENDATGLTGRLCPVGRPLAEVRDGSWRADGRLADVAASVPFLAMNFDRVEGALAVTGGPAGLGLQARIASGRVQDATEPRRFHPLVASGQATLLDERWTGAFDLAAPGGQPVGRVTLAHDGTTEAGGVVIETPELVFTPEGLQPHDLTPLIADIVRSPVTGAIDFSGRFDWSPTLGEGGSSAGRLTIPGLDFVSPAGPVKGLSGVIDFTSLAPLITAPGQTLGVATLETAAPLTDLKLTFALDARALSVAAGDIRAAGGVIRVEPFAVPLDRDQPFSGVIVLDRVQLGEIVTGAKLDDKVQLDAVVSGRLPFTYALATGVRISGGNLAAAQPGRLSIQREALTGLDAGGGGAIPPGTVEDLAYQAMQNLAFDTLSAEVNSLPEGRIGVLFHIKGRHDPPELQELRLSLSELISREFLNRPLPLPSDTGIDLTLETTLNLNQLVSDLIAANRARNGAAPTPEPDPTPEPAPIP